LALSLTHLETRGRQDRLPQTESVAPQWSATIAYADALRWFDV
jgi:hypothetical protein